LDVEFVGQSSSQTGYDVLRRYLPFPDRSTLCRHYHDQINEYETMLFDSAFIRKIIATHDSFTNSTLGIDAISLDHVFETNKMPQESSE
jgi:hypothetical protein